MLALLTGLMETLPILLFDELCLKYFIGLLGFNQLYLIVRIILISQTLTVSLQQRKCKFLQTFRPLRIVSINLSVHSRNVS